MIIAMPTPLRVTPGEMYAMAAFCILEGSPDLQNTHEQLKVAAVIVNRMNASNWQREFGRGVLDQLFARGQFEVQTKYGLDRADFDSFEKAAQALADAKPGLSLQWAKTNMAAFIRDAADSTKYTAAATEIGDSTGFRGNGRTNTFRKESRYDEANVSREQPSSIEINWPAGVRPPF